MKRSACLLNFNSKKDVLVVTRRFSDMVCMPGGAVEENETEIEAVIREVFEETGCIIKADDLIPLCIGFGDKEHKHWTTCYLSTLDLEPIQKEDGIIPQYVDLKDFLDEKKSFFIDYNYEVFFNFLKFLSGADKNTAEKLNNLFKPYLDKFSKRVF